MPIEPNPDKNHPMPLIATWNDDEGNRKYRQCANLDEAEATIMDGAGPMSAGDLPKISCRGVSKWFLRKQLRRKVLPHSVDKYEDSFRFLLEPYGDLPFGDLEEPHFEAIRDRLLELATANTYSITTVRNIVMDLQQLVNDASLRGAIEYNPARIAFKPVPKGSQYTEKVIHPSDSEVWAMRRRGTALEVAFIDCITETGTGLFETLRIRWPDCDFDNDMLKIRGTPSEFDPDGEALSHRVPMSARLKASLLRLRFLTRFEDAETLFTGTNGEAITISTTAPMLCALQVSIGMLAAPTATGRWRPKVERQLKPEERKRPLASLGKYTATHLRHYCAVRWAKTVSIKVLADRLGIKVSTAERLYGSIYSQRMGRDFLLARRAQRQGQ